MNGKTNMKQVIKESSKFNTIRFDKNIVSDETVNSGNYNDAQRILLNCSATGDLLAEIETDKAIMEFESSEDGTLKKILVNEDGNDPGLHTLLKAL